MPDWFIVNVADAPALAHRQGGTYVPFESRDARFPDYGINIHVIRPGEPNARYHAEDAQEDFLKKNELVRTRETRTNFVKDAVDFKLQAWEERGKGSTNMGWEMSGNTQIDMHVSEMPSTSARALASSASVPVDGADRMPSSRIRNRERGARRSWATSVET